VVAHLAPAAYQRLTLFARAGRVPMLPVLLAAFAHVLGRLTGQDDLVIGSTFGNRSRPRWSGLVGEVANSLPLRIRLSPGLTPRGLVARAAQVARAAHGAQEVPLPTMLAAARGTGPDRPPPYRAMLTLQRTPGPLAGGGLTADAVSQQLGTARLELGLWPCPAPDGGLDLLAQYSTDLFDADRIGDLLADLVRVLDRFTDSPDTPLETA
jgi:non-ribosomal peptide synthetase component F